MEDNPLVCFFSLKKKKGRELRFVLFGVNTDRYGSKIVIQKIKALGGQNATPVKSSTNNLQFKQCSFTFVNLMFPFEPFIY